MIKWLKKIFNKSQEQKCEHIWKLEEPTMNFGNSFKMWEGPMYNYCTKCGERRPHPECRHMWFLAPDDDEKVEFTVNGKKMVRTAICGKCGASKYEALK